MPYSRKCTYQMWECWMYLAHRSQTLVSKTPQGFLYDIWATMTHDLGYGPVSASQLSEVHRTNHHTLVIAQVHATMVRLWCPIMRIRGWPCCQSVCRLQSLHAHANGRSHACVHITSMNSTCRQQTQCRAI